MICVISQRNQLSILISDISIVFGNQAIYSQVVQVTDHPIPNLLVAPQVLKHYICNHYCWSKPTKRIKYSLAESDSLLRFVGLWLIVVETLISNTYLKLIAIEMFSTSGIMT